MRSYKLDEFAAHAGAVNCLKIGRKSCGVLVTGGDDKRVNVWAIGKPNAILSLAGHASPVVCVCFDTREEVVAAGGQNGTVKLWDLNASKAVRTLTGHRSSCLSVEFHPFGEFVATGSLDTNLKLWDLRRKECIQTYKGHKHGVTHAGVSPDGRWVASGCEGGAVKLWDLSSGRLLHEFRQHDGAITGLEFHPQEFLLATASADRTVRTWDLETWELLHAIGPDPQQPRVVCFHPAGRDLLVATQDGVAVWGVEPACHHDTVPVAWGRVADASVYDQRLVGCTPAGCGAVGVHVVDLKRVAPFSGAAAAVAKGHAVGGRGEAAARAHQLQPPQVQLGQQQQQQQQQRERQQAAQQQQQHQALPQLGLGGSRGSSVGSLVRALSERSRQTAEQTPKALAKQQSFGERASTAPAATPAAAGLSLAVAASQRPNTSPADVLARGSSSSNGGLSTGGEATLARPWGPGIAAVEGALAGPRPLPQQRAQQQQQQQQQQPHEHQQEQRHTAAAAGPVQALLGEELLQRDAATSTGGLHSNSDGGSSYVPAAGRVAAGMQRRAPGHSCCPEVEIFAPAHPPPLAATAAAGAVPAAAPDLDTGRGPFSFALSRDVSASSAGAPRSVAGRPPTHRGASSLPATAGGAPSGGGGPVVAHRAATSGGGALLAPPGGASPPRLPPVTALQDPLLSAAAYRPSLRVDLSRALSTLHIARGFVARGNMEGAYRAAAQSGDAAAAAMLVEALQHRRDAFDVPSTEALARALDMCLSAGPEHEHAAGVALGALGLAMRGPGQVIRETLAAGTLGVDLNFEARRAKCAAARAALQQLAPKLAALARGCGPLAARAQAAAADLAALELS